MATTLTKGQNGPLGSTDVEIAIDLATAGDLSALLVTDAGKVRTDADFVFFNQPSGPGVTLVSGSGVGTLRLDLSAVPADISQIRAVITLENGTFGAVAAPVAHVRAGGADAFEYRIDGLSSESIVIALEVYRRGADWKVRAVGQGYAGGFAALVTDHGVSVDDAPTPPAATPPAAPTPPPAAPTPSVSYSRPAPATPPPAPPAPPAAVAPAGAQPWPTASTGEVSLSKDRPVSLTKGQRVSLQKDGGVALTRITMGLGWDPILTKKGLFGGGRSSNIDLDASAMMFAGTQLADLAYYGQLVSKDGSVKHHGDNLTGEGDGDDEVIDVDLTRIPQQITQILFIVTSYQGQTFEQVDNAFCRLVDQSNRAELARYTLAGGMPFTGIVMAKVFRGDGGWKLQAVGEGMAARHPGEAAKQIQRFL
ncbi:stress protein [Williamsia sp. Leaf354]|uniref:TerD family protein n=1 Tax=Williamsia sp. Leaf354 TaxID=1736349 RepID=UPI0006F43E18|nr:TerD family protein [Williamsia sp. Leaf354]KQR98564.1 stress protein [Williamsia sp. Leaf354]